MVRNCYRHEGLGAGHGNVGIGKDKIFVLGMPDSIGVLYAFDFEGKLLWKKRYGPEWYKSYTGPRATPTIVGDLVYFTSGQGVVFCYNANTGNLIWSVDLLKQFNGRNFLGHSRVSSYKWKCAIQHSRWNRKQYCCTQPVNRNNNLDQPG